MCVDGLNFHVKYLALAWQPVFLHGLAIANIVSFTYGNTCSQLKVGKYHFSFITGHF